MFYSQTSYNIRFEQGLPGLLALQPDCEVMVIIDVLSFTTCVEIATSRGALIYPFAAGGERTAEEFSQQVGALLARPSGALTGYSLSAASLLEIPAGTRLVLPSPNGSRLSLAVGDKPVLAGCLRNASAVAQAAAQMGEQIAVIAAGERWSTGELRPALEDVLGAGAIIAALEGSKSPEAQAAQAVFERFAGQLEGALVGCSSGRELIERNRRQDVTLAAAFNTSRCVPCLRDGCYERGETF